MISAPSGFWTPPPSSKLQNGSQDRSRSMSDVQIKRTTSGSSRWQTLPQVGRLRKGAHARLGAKAARQMTVRLEATILVARQDRSNAASLTAEASRNSPASRVSGSKRNIGTSPATLASCGRQAGRLPKPHAERRQGRIVAADLPYPLPMLMKTPAWLTGATAQALASSSLAHSASCCNRRRPERAGDGHESITAGSHRRRVRCDMGGVLFFNGGLNNE